MLSPDPIIAIITHILQYKPHLYISIGDSDVTVV